jgi:hypothetical protein
VPGKLLSRLVISLIVMLLGDAVSVRGKIMELRGSLVPIVPAATASAV